LFDRRAGRIHLKLDMDARLAGELPDRAGEALAVPAVEQVRDEGVAHDHGVAVVAAADPR